MNPKCSLLFLIFFPLFFSAAYGVKWDLEYWQFVNVKNWKKGDYELFTSGVVRFDQNISDFYYARLTENFVYQPLSYLNLEIHYSYIYNKPQAGGKFTHDQRLELEVNPLVRLNHKMTFQWRNRMEFTKKQSTLPLQSIFRHRVMAIFPIKNGGRLINILCSDEIFYDFNRNTFTQNRFIPAELRFIFPKDITIDLFVMVRNIFNTTSGIPYRSIVLGSQLAF